MYSPYQKYQEQSVMTMTNGEMLVRLYEETAKMLKKGMIAIDNNDVVAANACLKKAQTIIKYLVFTLDRRIPLSENLSALYDYFNTRISDGNALMEKEPIAEILPMIVELGEAFAEGERIMRRQQQVVSESGHPNLTLAVNG